MACRLARSSSARLSSQHVHARLAEEAERAAVGVLVDQSPAPASSVEAARRGDARRLERARWRARCAGRAPSRRPSTASTGTVASGSEAVLARGTRHAARATACEQRRGWSGRGSRRARHRVVAVARPPTAAAGSSCGAVNVLPDQARADDLAVALDQRAVRPGREGDLRDPGDDERVDDPGQDGEGEEDDDARRRSWRRIRRSPARPTMRSISLIPTNGATMPPRP